MVWVDENSNFQPSGGLQMNHSKAGRINKEAKSGQIIKIEQEQLTRHLDKIVKATVEDTLNALLDAEADRLCQARRYERMGSRNL
jgi:hypothetical protein